MRLLSLIIPLTFLVLTACLADNATVTVNYNSPIGTINTEYGMNEVDRAKPFAGIGVGSNAQILQNHRDIKTARIRVFYRPDWTQANLDKLVKAVVDCGAVPMICFQFIPAGTTYEQWGDWCAAAVSRYKAMYDISNWMWELINEPDLTGWSQSTYVDMFTVVEPKIHAAYPQAMVGGPGTAALLTTWNNALFASSSGNNIQFISWHRYGGWYPGPNWPSDATILYQLQYYEQDIDNAYNALPVDRKNVKLIMGEFNVNAWAGDVNGLWATDPRIKTTFNAVYYASLLKRFFRTGNGRFVATEMFWEGTGDDYAGGPPGFGMWYAQQPANRAPVFYAKKNIAKYFPRGATLVDVQVSGSSTVEAFACRYGNPGETHLVLINKTTGANVVDVNAVGGAGNGVWYVVDDVSPAGRVETSPSMPITMTGYTVRVLAEPSPDQVLITSRPTVTVAGDSATVTWKTNIPSDSAVSYGLTPAYGLSESSSYLTTQHSITLTGLSEGSVYHYSVQSGGPGLVPAASEDAVFLMLGSPVRIGEARLQIDGASVALANKVVSAVFPADGVVYVQEADRSAGIRILTTQESLAPGDIVSLTGSISTRTLGGVPCERQIAPTILVKTGSGQTPAPLVSNCASIGGERLGVFTPGVKDAQGLNNVGLLRSVTGRIMAKAGANIYVDDGADIRDNWGIGTVLVQCPSLTLPAGVAVGNTVRVTGVAEGSVPGGWSENRRFLQIRSWDDLSVLN
ncbi:MAG: hypothetical protein IT209_01035 [Armatimonadetes bacterium]|nr:hypothetical protein [Armatimonadota bacterium]